MHIIYDNCTLFRAPRIASDCRVDWSGSAIVDATPPPLSPSRNGRRARAGGTWWPDCRGAAHRRRCRRFARSWLWHCVVLNASTNPKTGQEERRSVSYSGEGWKGGRACLSPAQLTYLHDFDALVRDLQRHLERLLAAWSVHQIRQHWVNDARATQTLRLLGAQEPHIVRGLLHVPTQA